MLEKQLSDLLATNLRRYICNLNEEQLQISLWSGKLVLRDLQLQSDIIDQIALLLLKHQKGQENLEEEARDANESAGNTLGDMGTDSLEDAATAQALLMPFTVIKGVIRELAIHVLWSALDREPVRVEIRAVELVFGPLRTLSCNLEEEQTRQGVIQQYQLSQYEKRRDAVSAAGQVGGGEVTPPGGADASPSAVHGNKPSDPAKKMVKVEKKKVSRLNPTSYVGAMATSYVERLIQAITRNIHIVMYGICVQYIFDYSDLDRTLAAAVSLWVDEISVASTDAAFEKQFVADPTAPICKKVTVGNLRASVHAVRKTTSSPALANSMSLHEGAPVASSVRWCFQNFCDQWEYNETLVEVGDVAARLKIVSNPIGAATVKSDDQKQGRSQGNASLQPNRLPKLHTELKITFVDTVQCSASFGALITLDGLACSLQDGFIGIPYRRHLHFLAPDPSPKTQRSKALRRWGFALACVRSAVAVNLQRSSSDGAKVACALDAMMSFARTRSAYCGLWKRHQMIPWLPSLSLAERDELIRLERQLTIEQAVFLRCLSYAELRVEQEMNDLQRQWITLATVQSKRTDNLPSLAASVQNQWNRGEQGLRRWFGWGQVREGRSGYLSESPTSSSVAAPGRDALAQGTTPTVHSSIPDTKARFLFFFQQEWRIAVEFLDQVSVLRRMESSATHSLAALPLVLPTSSATTGASGNAAARDSVLPLVLLLRCSALNISLVPRYWTTGSFSPPAGAFFPHFEQRFSVRVKDLACFSNPVQEPRADRAGLSFYVASLSAFFSGTFNTPLFNSCESRTHRSAHNREDFIVFKRNALCTRVVLTVSSFIMLLRPTHELFWWGNEILQFFRIMQNAPRSIFLARAGKVSYTEHATAASRQHCEALAGQLVPPTAMLPFLDFSFGAFEVLIPLFSHDIAMQDLALLHASGIRPRHRFVDSYLSPTSKDLSDTRSTQWLNRAGDVPSEAEKCNEEKSDDVALGSHFIGKRNSIWSDEMSWIGTDVSVETMAADPNTFAGEPYLVLSIPCAHFKSVKAPAKRHTGPESEYVLTVGDDLKGVRFFCNVGQSSAAPVRTFEILSFVNIYLLVNPTAMSIGLYNGVEVSVEPQVLALLNDRMLRPDVLYTDEHLSSTKSLLENLDRQWSKAPQSAIVPAWRFAFADQLHLGDGSILQIPSRHGREYATLLYRWMQDREAELVKTSDAGKNPREGDDGASASQQAPAAHSQRSYSLCIDFARIFVRNFWSETVFEMELMAPNEASLLSLPYRRFFSFFSSSSHALELLLRPADFTFFNTVADVSFTNGAGKSLGALQSLTIRCDPMSDNVEAEIEKYSLFFSIELVECAELLAGVANIFVWPPPLLLPSGLSDVASRGARPSYAPSSRPAISWRLVVKELLAELPFTSSPDYPYQAFSITTKNILVEYFLREHVAQAKVDGYVEQALRIEYDASNEKMFSQFVIIGPSTDLVTHSAYLCYSFAFRWAIPQSTSAPSMESEASICTFHVKGGYLSIYMPFIQQSVAALSGSLYYRLFNFERAFFSAHNTSMVSQSSPHTSINVDEHTDTVPSLMHFSGTIEDMDILFPTDSDILINTADDNTFFYLYLGEVTLNEVNDGVTGSPSFEAWRNYMAPRFLSSPVLDLNRRRQFVMNLGKMAYVPFREQPPSPLPLEISLFFEFGVLLVLKDDLTRYTCVPANQSNDMALLVFIRPGADCGREEGGGSKSWDFLNLAENAAMIDLVFSPTRLTALMRVVTNNFMRSSFSIVEREGGDGGARSIGGGSENVSLHQNFFNSCSQADPLSHAPLLGSALPVKAMAPTTQLSYARTTMLVLLPLRVSVLAPNQRLVSVSVIGGIQYYCAQGGVWSGCPIQNLQLRKVALEEGGYGGERRGGHVISLLQRHPATRATIGSPPLYRNLLEVRRFGVTMLVSTEAVPFPGSSHYRRIEGFVEGMTVHADVHAWMRVVGFFSDTLFSTQTGTALYTRTAATANEGYSFISADASWAESEVAATNLNMHKERVLRHAPMSFLKPLAAPAGVVIISDLSVTLKEIKVVVKESCSGTLAILEGPRWSLRMVERSDGIVQTDIVADVAPCLLFNTGKWRSELNTEPHPVFLTPLIFFGGSVLKTDCCSSSTPTSQNFIHLSITQLNEAAPLRRFDEMLSTPPTLVTSHCVELKVHGLQLFLHSLCCARLMHFVLDEFLPAFQEGWQHLPHATTLNPAPATTVVSWQLSIAHIQMHFPLSVVPHFIDRNDCWTLQVCQISTATHVEFTKVGMVLVPTKESHPEGPYRRLLAFEIVATTRVSNIQLRCEPLYPIVLPDMSLESTFPLYDTFYLELEASETGIKGSGENETRSGTKDAQYCFMLLENAPPPVVLVRRVRWRTASPCSIRVSLDHFRGALEVASTWIKAQTEYMLAQNNAAPRRPSERTHIRAGHVVASSSTDKCSVRLMLEAEIGKLVLNLINVGVSSGSSALVEQSHSGFSSTRDTAPFASLTKLHVIDPLTLRLEYGGELDVTQLQVFLVGAFELWSGDGALILSRRPGNAIEPTFTSTAEPMESSLNHTIALSVAMQKSSGRVTVEGSTAGIMLNVAPETFEYALCIQKVVQSIATIKDAILCDRHLDSMDNPLAPPSALPQPALHTSSDTLSLNIQVRSFGFSFGETALLSLRGIQTSFSKLQILYAHLSDGAVTATMDPELESAREPPGISVGEVVLLEWQNPSRICAQGEQIELGVSDKRICVRVQHVRLNNYDACFLSDLAASFILLEMYISKHFKLPASEKGEGEWHDIFFFLGNLQTRLYSPRNSSSVGGGGYVEIFFPGIAIRYEATRGAVYRQCSVETEDGVVSYIQDSVDDAERTLAEGRADPDPASHLLVSNLKVSLQIQEDLKEKLWSAALRFGALKCTLLIGNTLQRCVEAITQLVLPLLASLAAMDAAASSPTCRVAMSTAADGSLVSSVEEISALEGLAEDECKDLPVCMASVAATPPFFTSVRYSLGIPVLVLQLRREELEEVKEVENAPRTAFRASAPVLLSIELHQISWEQLTSTIQNQVSVLQVAALTSTVDSSMQSVFVSATAAATAAVTTGAAVDVSDKVALYLCRESAPTLSNAETQGFSVTGRLHAFKLTVSPSLLRLLNEKVLACIARGVSRVRETHGLWAAFQRAPLRGRPVQINVDSTRISVTGVASSSSSLNMVDSADGVLIIHTDLCLRKSLRLGGREGNRIHFVKASFLGHSPRNLIRIKSVNHAQLLLSFKVLLDGRKQAPLIIDEGLTVLIEDTPVVLCDAPVEGGGSPRLVQDYAVLGERSLLLVPEKLVVRHCRGPAITVAGAASSQCISSGQPAHIAVTANYDLAFDAHIHLWSQQQVISLFTEVCARYWVKKQLDVTTGELASVIAENGEVALQRLALTCDCGPITAHAASLVLNIQHHKLVEDDSKAGITMVRAVMPPVQLSVTAGHLRLLLNVLQQLQTGNAHIGSTMIAGKANASVGSSEPLLSEKKRSIPRRSGNVANSVPSFEVSLTVPSIEFVLTNDFFKPLLVCSVLNLAAHVRGLRNLSVVSCRGTTDFAVYDYPTTVSAPRTLVHLAPEIVMDYAWYSEDGVSFTGSLVCAETSATVPLSALFKCLTTLDALHPGQEEVGAFTFKNELGISVVLTAAGTDSPPASSTTYCCLPAGSSIKADLFHYKQTRFRVLAVNEAEYNPYDVAATLAGTEVDLSLLQRGTTYRFPLEEPSTGVLDVALRLEDTERLVRLTSTVTIRNDLNVRSVHFLGGLSPALTLAPLESCFAPLDMLKHALFMRIDEFVWHAQQPSAFLSLQSFLSAFLLMPDSPKGQPRGKGDDAGRGLHASSGKQKGGLLRERTTCAAILETNTLILPLLLHRDTLLEDVALQPQQQQQPLEMPAQLVVHLVVKRQLARECQPRTARLLPKYEVELVIRPVASVVNYTGTPLIVEFFVPRTRETSVSAAEGKEDSLPVIRSELLPHGGRHDWYPVSAEEAAHAPHMMLELHMEERCLRSRRPVELSSRKECTVVMQCLTGAPAPIGLAVRRLSESAVAVCSLAILVNELPVPLRPLSDAFEAVLVGCESQVGAADQKLSSSKSHPLFFPCGEDGCVSVERDALAATRLCVAAGSHLASPSESFPLLVPCLAPALLSCLDGNCEWLFMVSQGVKSDIDVLPCPNTTLTTALESPLPLLPTLVFKPRWVIHNMHTSMALLLHFTGLSHEYDVRVLPQCTMPLCAFGSSSHGNPEVSFRYEKVSGESPGVSGDCKLYLGSATPTAAEVPPFRFEWSPALTLVALATASVPVSFKHRLILEDHVETAVKYPAHSSCTTVGDIKTLVEHLSAAHDVRLLVNTRVPTEHKASMEVEAFTCFSLTVSVEEGQCVFQAALDEGPPLIIENRTSYMVQFKQIKGTHMGSTPALSRSLTEAWGFIAASYTDVAVCWEVPSLETPAVHFILARDDITWRSLECTVDLRKAAASQDVIKVGNSAFIFVMLNYERRCFFVSILEDRALESRLLLQPRFVARFELFIPQLSIFVASVCVPQNTTTTLTDTVFAPLLERGVLNLEHVVCAESTDAEVLSALQAAELDVVQVCVTDLVAEVLWNDRHALGRLQVGRLQIVDCTSPSPVFPIVLCIGSEEKEARPAPAPHSDAITQKDNSEAVRGADPAGGVGEATPPIVGVAPCFAVRLHFLRLHSHSRSMEDYLFAKDTTHDPVVEPCDVKVMPGVSQPAVGQRVKKRRKSTMVTSQLVTVPIEHFHIQCSTICIRMHDSFLYVLRQAAESLLELWHHSRSSSHQDRRETPLMQASTKAIRMYDFYVTDLVISPISLQLTLKRRVDGRYSPYDGLGNFMVPSVEGAPLCISRFCRKDVNQRASSPCAALLAVLWPAYRTQLLFQLYKVVGSMEVLGNPVALIGGWGRGMRSLVKSTVQLDFVAGAQEFWKETSSSTLHSVGLLSRVGSRTLAALSLGGQWVESQYGNGQHSTDAAFSLKDDGVWAGLTQGVYGGIEGVLHEPVAGARASGMPGFLVGMASGMMGLVSRPISGFLHGVGGAAEFYARRGLSSDSLAARIGAAPVRSPHQLWHAYMRSGRNFLVREHSLGEFHTDNDSGSSSSRVTTPLPSLRWKWNSFQPLFASFTVDTGEFISSSFYRSTISKLMTQCRAKFTDDHEVARATVDVVGPRNYALHVPYKVFLRHTTPEEFYDWVHIALDAHLARELEEFLQAAPMRTSEGTLDGRPPKGLLKEDEGQRMALTQALTIKTTLGMDGLLKYVPMDLVVRICTLGEIKANMSPEDLQHQCGLLLLQHRCSMLRNFLQMSVP